MRHEKLSIIFHGDNASNFRPGFERLLATQHRLIDLSEGLASAAERSEYERADVIVGVKFNASLPLPRHLSLFHAPAAGTDAIDLDLLPASAALCNCFGHEAAIAEYVMTALLLRHVPLAAADADLRAQRWTYWAGRLTGLRTELGGQTIGLLGFGHIAKAIAARAKAFGMGVHVANRSAVSSPLVDRYFSLAELPSFMGSADSLVVSLPLAEQTRGLIGQAELAAMRPEAVILNVGRGPVIEEQALFDALAERRIGGAIIPVPDANTGRMRPLQPGLCQPAKCRDDTAYVRLDHRHGAATSAHHGRQYCALGRRAFAAQCGQASGLGPRPPEPPWPVRPSAAARQFWTAVPLGSHRAPAPPP